MTDIQMGDRFVLIDLIDDTTEGKEYKVVGLVSNIVMFLDDVGEYNSTGVANIVRIPEQLVPHVDPVEEAVNASYEEGFNDGFARALEVLLKYNKDNIGVEVDA